MDLATTISIVILFFITVAAYVIGKAIGKLDAEKKIHEIVQKAREDATKRSRLVLTGQFSEQIAPYLPNFPYSPTEVRFIGKPIDFIVFKGMDNKEIKEVIFLEVKTRKSALSTHEKKLKDTINNKKVRWDEYRVKQE